MHENIQKSDKRYAVDSSLIWLCMWQWTELILLLFIICKYLCTLLAYAKMCWITYVWSITTLKTHWL